MVWTREDMEQKNEVERAQRSRTYRQYPLSYTPPFGRQTRQLTRQGWLLGTAWPAM